MENSIPEEDHLHHNHRTIATTMDLLPTVLDPTVPMLATKDHHHLVIENDLDRAIVTNIHAIIVADEVLVQLDGNEIVAEEAQDIAEAMIEDITIIIAVLMVVVLVIIAVDEETETEDDNQIETQPYKKHIHT